MSMAEHYMPMKCHRCGGCTRAMEWADHDGTHQLVKGWGCHNCGGVWDMDKCPRQTGPERPYPINTKRGRGLKFDQSDPME